MAQRETEASGGGLSVALAWTVVMIPLLWGVYSTILNVVKLFS